MIRVELPADLTQGSMVLTMKTSFKLYSSWLLMTALLITGLQVQADELGTSETMLTSKNKLYVELGSYVHYSSSDDHAGTPIFTSIRVQRPDNWQYGLALFNNSFGQFSQYAFGGYRWELYGTLKNFHVIGTAGIIHGYTGKFEDKIPFNYEGWSPGLSLGVGYKKGKFGADVTTLGAAGLLFTVGYDVWEF